MGVPASDDRAADFSAHGIQKDFHPAESTPEKTATPKETPTERR